MVRNRLKSLGRPYNVALRATEMTLLAHFGIRILAKFTVEALLLPLFGQFQKSHSRKFSFRHLNLAAIW